MRVILAVILLIGSASGLFLEDARSDAAFLIAEQQSIPGAPSEPVDLWSLEIFESVDSIFFAVESAGRGTATAGQTWDAARLDVRFRNGEIWYDVGTGIEISGVEFSELRAREGNGGERVVGTPNLESDGAGMFTVEVPRDWLRDHNGAPPQKGTIFEELHMDAHAHSTGVFLTDQDGNLFQPIGIRDRMPDAGNVDYVVQTGGPSTTGLLQAEIPLPYRASNGGTALIAYEALLSHAGGATYEVELVNGNAEYTISYPETIFVEQNSSFQIFLETPDRHNHGGNEEITFKLTDLADSENSGLVTFGIHYLTIPQPAGHHSNIYFHSRAAPQPLLGSFGGTSGIVSFNTMEMDDLDENIAVSAGGLGSVAAFWDICLDPELRLGLQANRTKEGQVDISFSGGGAGTGTLTWFLAPALDCAGNSGAETLAQSVVSGTFDGSFSFPIPPMDVRKPYEKGMNMGFRMEIIFDQPSTGPVNLVGGSGILPLDEYYDERPAGLTGDAIVQAAPEPEAATEETEETPANSLLLLMLGLAFVARRRF